MTEVCVTWKQPDGDHFNGWCTNRFRLTTPPEGVAVVGGCQLCVTPISREPPVDCFGCSSTANEWPLSYTLYGDFAFTTSVLNSQTYTAEDDDYTGERTAVSFSWSAADVIAFCQEALLINTFTTDPSLGHCYWGKAVSRMNFLQSIGAVDKAAADACGTARNHSPEWRSFVTDDQEMTWPLYTGLSDDPVYDPLTNGWALTLGNPQKYSVLDGRVWPTGYGINSGGKVPADVNQGDINGYISDLPYYPDCPSIISGFLPHNWFSAAYQKSLSMLLERIFLFGSPRYSLTIAVNNGGIPQKSMYFNKPTGKWMTGSPPITVTNPVPDLEAARLGGCTYHSEVDCNNRSVITLTRFSGSTEWPTTVYLKAN